MPVEAIILAGGLGTRLRTVVDGIPKCMAPVNGRPFLDYVLDHLVKQGTDRFIFSLGYRSEMIMEYADKRFQGSGIRYSVEPEPLGTGGALKAACKLATQKNVLVVNGDTLFALDTVKLMSFHNLCGADCTLSLKPMQDFDRYGVVELKSDYSISDFREKQHYEKGLINAGVYALNADKFNREDLPEKFSFEKDYLENFTGRRRFYGVVQDCYFIDIGIPEDYERAQKELGMGN